MKKREGRKGRKERGKKQSNGGRERKVGRGKLKRRRERIQPKNTQMNLQLLNSKSASQY